MIPERVDGPAARAAVRAVVAGHPPDAGCRHHPEASPTCSFLDPEGEPTPGGRWVGHAYRETDLPRRRVTPSRQRSAPPATLERGVARAVDRAGRAGAGGAHRPRHAAPRHDRSPLHDADGPRNRRLLPPGVDQADRPAERRWCRAHARGPTGLSTGSARGDRHRHERAHHVARWATTPGRSRQIGPPGWHARHRTLRSAPARDQRAVSWLPGPDAPEIAERPSSPSARRSRGSTVPTTDCALLRT
jgi:hypothetical protein